MKARLPRIRPPQDVRTQQIIFASRQDFKTAVEQEFLALYEKSTEDIAVQLIAIQLYIEELEHHHRDEWLKRHMESIFRVTDMLVTGLDGFGKPISAMDIVDHYKKKGIDIDAEYKRHTWRAAPEGGTI